MDAPEEDVGLQDTRLQDVVTIKAGRIHIAKQATARFGRLQFKLQFKLPGNLHYLP